MSGSLPHYETPLIGRQGETELALTLLRTADPPVRVLTLTGPGGVGKTRLAVQVAADWAQSTGDEVYYATLAAVADPSYVPITVARAINAQDTGSLPVADVVRDFIGTRHCLLVLDNFEQVKHAASFVADLIATCPNLRMLITSRSPLHIAYEADCPVPPLVLPDLSNLPSAYILSNYAAIALFLQRAQTADPKFALTQENAAAIAEICMHLDGLPLAIELAAARIQAIPPHAMRERLQSRLMLLVGDKHLPARHQSLRAAIDWSYNLLSEPERKVFARAAVFANACTEDYASTVCSVNDDVSDVGAILRRLAEQSLMRVSHLNNVPRYALLETIREYALERLAERGETSLIRDKHTQYFLELAEYAETQLHGHQQQHWLERLEADLDNIRAAIGWALDTDEYALGQRLVSALSWFWVVRGSITEGREWAEKALIYADRTAARAKTLLTASRLTAQSDIDRSESYAQEALEIAQAINHPQLMGGAYFALGRAAANRGDAPSIATDCYEHSLRLFRQIEYRHGVADALFAMGVVAGNWGNHEQAMSLYEESLNLRRIGSDSWGIARILTSMAIVTSDQGDLALSEKYSYESLALYKEIGDQGSAAAASLNLAHIATVRGEYAAAKSLCQEALTVWERSGRRVRVASALRQFAIIAAAEGEYDRAQSFSDRSLDLCRRLGFRLGLIPGLVVAGKIAVAVGNYMQAETLLTESLALCKQSGDTVNTALATIALGYSRLRQNHPTAIDYLKEGLTALQATGEKISMVDAIEHIAAARAGSSPTLAACLWGATDTARQTLGAPLEPARRPAYETALESIRAIDAAAFQSAWVEGAALTLPQAIALALQ